MKPDTEEVSVSTMSAPWPPAPSSKLDDDIIREVMEAAISDPEPQWIQAIKQIRDRTGMPLKEAYEHVRNYEKNGAKVWVRPKLGLKVKVILSLAALWLVLLTCVYLSGPKEMYKFLPLLLFIPSGSSLVRFHRTLLQKWAFFVIVAIWYASVLYVDFSGDKEIQKFYLLLMFVPLVYCLFMLPQFLQQDRALKEKNGRARRTE